TTRSGAFKPRKTRAQSRNRSRMRCGLSPRCARGICCIRGLGRGSASQAKWEAAYSTQRRRALATDCGEPDKNAPTNGGGPEGTPPGRPRYGASTKNQRGLRRGQHSAGRPAVAKSCRGRQLRDGARITLHCAAGKCGASTLACRVGTPADARCLRPAEASSCDCTQKCVRHDSTCEVI